MLSVFSDGHGDLRHWVQHQIVHDNLERKNKTLYDASSGGLSKSLKSLKNEGKGHIVSDLVSAPSSLPGALLIITCALVRFPWRRRTRWDSLVV